MHASDTKSNPSLEELRPSPLVLAEVNLSGFPWAPARMDFFLTHALALLPSAEPFRAFVLLMAQAWRQTPSMTLPTDDASLAFMAGFGRDIPSWLAIRAQVMQDWVLCDDGRWHHSEFATWAHQSWESKKKDQNFRALQRLRALSRTKGSASSSDEISGESRGSTAAQPYERTEQETERTEDEQTGDREKRASNDWSSSLIGPSSVGQKSTETKDESQQVCEIDPVLRVYEHWKLRTDRPSEPLTKSREKVIRARLNEGSTADQICLAIDAAANSDFYQGRKANYPTRMDTLDVICANRDRILQLISEGNSGRRPITPKLSTQRTADNFKAILAARNSAIVDVDARELTPIKKLTS